MYGSRWGYIWSMGAVNGIMYGPVGLCNAWVCSGDVWFNGPGGDVWVYINQ